MGLIGLRCNKVILVSALSTMEMARLTCGGRITRAGIAVCVPGETPPEAPE